MFDFFDNDDIRILKAWAIIFVILGVVLYIGQTYKHKQAELLKTRNFNAIIYETNYDELHISTGKSKIPMLCNSVLFKSINGEYANQYFKLNSCGDIGHIILTDSWIYNHQKNDTVFFESLRKDRFFKIKEKK